MNKQREIIYAHRAGVFGGDILREDVTYWIEDVVDSLITRLWR